MSEFLGRIAVSIAATGFYFAASVCMFGAMQQCGYKNAKFFSWLKKKDNLWYNRLSLLFLIELLSCTLTALCFSFLGASYAQLLALLPFSFFALLFCATESKTPLKVPVKKTGRTLRLGAVYALLLGATAFLLISLFDFSAALLKNDLFSSFSVSALCLLPLFLPILFAFANLLSCLFEEPRNARFVKKASDKYRASTAIKIGVTGSFGKTSVKRMLETVLSEKFRVAATPQSYNTPVGIAKAVGSPSFDGAEVFVAEMGAAKSGDIEQLCGLFPVDYGVITGVCRQHSATFGGVEEIFAEKKKLATNAAKKAVCSAAIRADFGDRFTEEEAKKTTFVPADAVKNIGGAPFETSFDLTLTDVDGNTQTRRVTLPVLGEGAAENAAIAAYTALCLGLTFDEIFAGLEKITPVPHRLQLICENGIYVLDDGYNASEKSAEQACKALAAFPAGKYVVTPGIVETGDDDAVINRPLGEKLARFDGVFLHESATAVKEGYLLACGEPSALHLYSSIEEVKQTLASLLREGDAVLFLNDLPDVY